MGEDTEQTQPGQQRERGLRSWVKSCVVSRSWLSNEYSQFLIAQKLSSIQWKIISQQAWNKSEDYLFAENIIIIVNLNAIGCSNGQKCMWVQKEKIKSFSERNPLLTIKLRLTPGSGNSQAAGCQQNIPLGKTAVKTSSILDSFPAHPTQVTVRNKPLGEMFFCRKTLLVLYYTQKLNHSLSRWWCQKKSNSSAWCTHL